MDFAKLIVEGKGDDWVRQFAEVPFQYSRHNGWIKVFKMDWSYLELVSLELN